MKQIVLVVGLFISLGSFSMVQGQDFKTEKPKKDRTEIRRGTPRGDRFSENLSEEQKKAVEKIKTDFNKDKKEIDNTKLTKEERDSKIRDLREKQKNAFDNILTAEQREQRDESPRHARKDGKKKNIDGKAREARVHHKSQQGGAKMFAGIELSDQQKTDFKALRKQNRENRREGEKRDRAQHMEEIKKILTPEQAVILEKNIVAMKNHKSTQQ